jgi:hypothetical protein
VPICAPWLPTSQLVALRADRKAEEVAAQIGKAMEFAERSN